jgi:hypothetical protein
MYERQATSMQKPRQLIYSFPRWDAVYFGTGAIARYFSRRRWVVAQHQPCDICTLQSSLIRGAVSKPGLLRASEARSTRFEYDLCGRGKESVSVILRT